MVMVWRHHHQCGQLLLNFPEKQNKWRSLSAFTFRSHAQRPWGEPSLTPNRSWDCSSKATRPGKATAESSFIHYPMLPPSAGLLQVYFFPLKEHSCELSFFCSWGFKSAVAGGSAAHDHYLLDNFKVMLQTLSLVMNGQHGSVFSYATAVINGS